MDFKEGTIWFNNIIVIESIPEGERQTGTEIHNDYLTRYSWLDKNLIVQKFTVNNRNEFLSLLDRIKNATKEGRYIPYLHFETHGGTDGILLKSGDFIKFSEFIDYLRDINQLAKNNLFVSIGACWGGRIQFETDIRKPCPFRGFIGPMEIIYPNDLVVSFSSFFDELLSSNDFDSAIKRLNDSNTSGVVFHHYNAEAFFDQVIALERTSLINSAARREEFVFTEARKKWSSDERIKARFRSRAKFRDFIRAEAKKAIPKSLKDLRDNFLHVRYRDIH